MACAQIKVSKELFVTSLFFQDLEQVGRILDDHRAGRLELWGSRPEAFWFPNAILVTGPLHIIWNSFERCVTASPIWMSFKEILSAILSFLGHKGLREGFLRTCSSKADPGQRARFKNWKHTVIDWKWEYMEETFRKLSAIILDLL